MCAFVCVNKRGHSSNINSKAVMIIKIPVTFTLEFMRFIL